MPAPPPAALARAQVHTCCGGIRAEDCKEDFIPFRTSCGRRVEVNIKSRDLAVPRDNEIHTGVPGRFALRSPSPTRGALTCAELGARHAVNKRNEDASLGDYPRTCPARRDRRERRAARTQHSPECKVPESRPFGEPDHLHQKRPVDCGRAMFRYHSHLRPPTAGRSFYRLAGSSVASLYVRPRCGRWGDRENSND